MRHYKFAHLLGHCHRWLDMRFWSSGAYGCWLGSSACGWRVWVVEGSFSTGEVSNDDIQKAILTASAHEERCLGRISYHCPSAYFSMLPITYIYIYNARADT
jgi:hypothetical protein